MRLKIENLLPKFVRLPLLLMLLFNFGVYILPSRLFVRNVARYDLTLALDILLPCLPIFALIYVLAYLQWVGSYVLHCRESVQLCYRIAAANIIAKLLCLLCFIFLPTRMVRPEVTGTGLFAWGTRLIHTIDDPVNLFPSIHCLESWMCFRSAMMLKKKNGWYIAGQGVFTLLVFASTVLIKQHFVIDIPAGILVCEIGLFLSRRCGLWRIFNKIQTPSAKAWLKQQSIPTEGDLK